MKTAQFQESLDNLRKRLDESINRQIPTMDHIMNVAEMSPTDKLFFDAYKKYGNRSHTWQDFRDMFNGNLDTMQKTVQHWKTWDEISDLSLGLEELEAKTKEFMRKYGVRSIDPKKNEEYEQYKKLYPDMVAAYDKYINLVFETVPNYCTFSPEVAQLEREFQNKSKSLPADDKQAKLDCIVEYINKMDDYISLKNADFVVAERIDTYRKIILSNTDMLNMASNFDNLSGADKVELARMILTESAKKYGTPIGRVVHDDAENGPHKLIGKQAGGYGHRIKTFLLKSDTFTTLFSFLSILAHEDGHRIDYYNPSYGMVGDQLMRFVENNYLNNEDIDIALYKKWATEQSSYYIDLPIAYVLKYAIRHSNNG